MTHKIEYAVATKDGHIRIIDIDEATTLSIERTVYINCPKHGLQEEEYLECPLCTAEAMEKAARKRN